MKYIWLIRWRKNISFEPPIGLTQATERTRANCSTAWSELFQLTRSICLIKFVRSPICRQCAAWTGGRASYARPTDQSSWRLSSLTRLIDGSCAAATVLRRALSAVASGGHTQAHKQAAALCAAAAPEASQSTRAPNLSALSHLAQLNWQTLIG